MNILQLQRRNMATMWNRYVEKHFNIKVCLSIYQIQRTSHDSFCLKKLHKFNQLYRYYKSPSKVWPFIIKDFAFINIIYLKDLNIFLSTPLFLICFEFFKYLKAFRITLADAQEKGKIFLSRGNSLWLFNLKVLKVKLLI